jgi:superkiller protein 3
MRTQLVKALSYLLPDSPLYLVLSGLPPPDSTKPMATTVLYIQSSVHNELPVLEEIVGLVEAQETAFMEKEVERRRTRLKAGSLKEVRNEIGREIWAESRVSYTICHLVQGLTVDQLPCLYNQILNHPSSTDELRRTTESKLLRHKVNYLHTLPPTEECQIRKCELGREIDELIRGVVLLKIPDELAWTLYVEEQDCETMGKFTLYSIYCWNNLVTSSS